MSRLMQSASALTVAAALAAAPFMAAAQTTESEAEQVLESTAQEVEQGAEQAAQEVEQAVEGAAQETEQAVEGAAQEAEQEAEQAGEAVEATVETVEQGAETAGQETEQAVEVEVQEDAGEAAQVVDPNTEVVVQTEAPVEEVEGAITLQDENSILTSDLMDATVFNPAGEKVGKIDDAIVSLDGTVEGVVIGVGGFLGIGEKQVAVEMQQLSVRMDEENDPQLIIDTTREALEAAPDFITAEEQRREAEQQAMEQAPAPGAEPAGGMMTSDPATGADPAAPAAEMTPAAPAEGETVKQD